MQAIHVDPLERIGTERPQRLGGAELRDPAADQSPEQAHVAVVHRVSVLQRQRGPHVRRFGLFGATAHPLPRHPQMRDQSFASVERKQHPFSESLDARQPATDQPAEPGLCLTADDARLLGPGRHDAAAFQPRPKLPRRNLHLGKLGHARSDVTQRDPLQPVHGGRSAAASAQLAQSRRAGSQRPSAPPHG